MFVTKSKAFSSFLKMLLSILDTTANFAPLLLLFQSESSCSLSFFALHIE